MTHPILVVIFSLLLVPALGMVFIPLFPTFWYLIIVATLFGFVDGFVHLTLANLAVLGALLGASIAVDWSAGLLGAKFGGAAWKSLILGAVGGLVGVLVMPPFGAFIGLFIGVFIGEILRRRETREAMKAATGALVGTLSGIAVNAILAILFIALFVLFAL